MSRTMATMAVPTAMYQLVKAKLVEAGYDQAIHPSRGGDSEAEILDMHGIALVADEAAPVPLDELRHRFLDWRGIDSADVCRTCEGTGRRLYGSTATWRGGIGGQMITGDVCDVCWGSGDRYHKGADLRQLRNEEGKRVAEAAVDALARSAGATLSSSAGAVREIIMILTEAADKADAPRGRSRSAARDSIWFAPLVRSLAALLTKAVSG